MCVLWAVSVQFVLVHQPHFTFRPQQCLTDANRSGVRRPLKSRSYRRSGRTDSMFLVVAVVSNNVQLTCATHLPMLLKCFSFHLILFRCMFLFWLIFFWLFPLSNVFSVTVIKWDITSKVLPHALVNIVISLVCALQPVLYCNCRVWLQILIFS